MLKPYAGKTTIAFINILKIKCRLEVNLKVNVVKYNILAKNETLGWLKSFKFSTRVSVYTEP